ncbi:hypothetical protein J3A83DRAFT_4374373 [Scleroderma citrinum]
MSTQSHSSTITPAPMDPINWMKVTDSALKKHPADNIDTAVAKAKEKGRRYHKEKEERVWRAAEEAQRKAEDKARQEAEEAKRRRVKAEKVKVVEEAQWAIAEREREQWASGSKMAMSDYPIANCTYVLIPKKFPVVPMKALS